MSSSKAGDLRLPGVASGGSPAAAANAVPLRLTEEGSRTMMLCNACRYCEGYCAVYPAMERRMIFTEQDLNYLANLCHNCGECYYACPYTPPHEFLLNPPRLFAETRLATYRKYAWPSLFGGLFERNGLFVTTAMIAAPAFLLLVLLAAVRPAVLFSAHPDANGAFYAVMPHNAMALTFIVISLFVSVALIAGALRFWRDIGEKTSGLFDPSAWLGAIGDSLRLRYLKGGGDGCAYPEEAPSHARRWFHHLTFYGFLLCFAATSVAAIYHYVFAWYAPYRFLSAPVLLGTLGGIGLMIGPMGLLWLKLERNQELSDIRQTGMDAAFLVLLLLTSVSGLLLLALRETAAMGTLLAIHLGIVAGLLLTMPYGKFVHAVYRVVALVRDHIEKRRPRLQMGSD